MAKWVYQTGNSDCHKNGINTDECLSKLADIVEMPERVMLELGPICNTFYQGNAEKACLLDTLNPNFDMKRLQDILSVVSGLYDVLARVLLIGALTVIGGGAGFACIPCAAIMQAVAPGLLPEFVGLPALMAFALPGGGLGLGALGGFAVGRPLAAMLELISVEAKAGAGTLGRLVNAFNRVCGPNSFTKGTPVLLADGTSKPIEDVQIGELVLSADPVTGSTRPERVTAAITGSGPKHLVDVTIDTDGQSGHATAKFTATDGHPFWAADLGQWVDAGNLHTGQWLRTGTGTWVQIARTHRRTETTTVYNLTVADLHTYHVVGGRTSVLVHNAGCIELTSIGAGRYKTPAGLVYGPGSVHEHRIFHVMAHGMANPARTGHSEFFLNAGESIMGTVDEAWASSERVLVRIQTNGNSVWATNMGRKIGTRGEQYICIVTRSGVELITSYPSLHPDCSF
jgi:hypothetical protein